MHYLDVVFGDHPRPVCQDLVDLVDLPQLGRGRLDGEAPVVPLPKLVPLAPVDRGPRGQCGRGVVLQDRRLKGSLEVEVVDADQVVAPVSGTGLETKTENMNTRPAL